MTPLPDDVVAEFLARCRAEWQAAGLPAHADPSVLDRVASIVATDQNNPVQL